MKILIVDDTLESLQMTELFLKTLGHEVTTSVHGKEALEKAYFCPPEILITDILMPVMDGLPFAEHGNHRHY